jgi:hypothetical protein
MKYALEGIKLLFVLNGASAVSILTFIGDSHQKSAALVCAMVAFAFGAFSAVVTMVCAYLAQLQYGNAESGGPSSVHLSAARRFHGWSYVAVAAGIILFVSGICSAAYGLLNG